jgi:hypothetical protein
LYYELKRQNEYYEGITVENTNSTTDFALINELINETMENDSDVTIVTIASGLFSLRW